MLNTIEVRDLLAAAVSGFDLKTFVLPCDELSTVKGEKFAIIVNTDPHNKPGQHWTAFYKSGGVLEFFDSLGQHPKIYGEDFKTFVENQCCVLERSNVQI